MHVVHMFDGHAWCHASGIPPFDLVVSYKVMQDKVSIMSYEGLANTFATWLSCPQRHCKADFMGLY